MRCLRGDYGNFQRISKSSKLYLYHNNSLCNRFKTKKRIISDTPLCSVGLKSGIPNIIKINTAKYTAAE